MGAKQRAAKRTRVQGREPKQVTTTREGQQRSQARVRGTKRGQALSSLTRTESHGLAIQDVEKDKPGEGGRAYQQPNKKTGYGPAPEDQGRGGGPTALGEQQRACSGAWAPPPLAKPQAGWLGARGVWERPGLRPDPSPGMETTVEPTKTPRGEGHEQEAGHDRALRDLMSRGRSRSVRRFG